MSQEVRTNVIEDVEEHIIKTFILETPTFTCYTRRDLKVLRLGDNFPMLQGSTVNLPQVVPS